jgi:FlaG/FlaF family flagellin (archaellin)
METPQDKAIGYVIVTILVSIVVSILVGTVSGALFGHGRGGMMGWGF